MSNPQTISIFTAKATDGIGKKIKTAERAVIGNSARERVTIQLYGTWETGVTVKPQISLDDGTTFTNVTKSKDDGTQVDVVFSADAAFILELSSHDVATLIVAGVGGTPPSINAKAQGNINEVT